MNFVKLKKEERRALEEKLVETLTGLGFVKEQMVEYLNEKVKEDQYVNNYSAEFLHKNEFYSRMAAVSQFEYLVTILKKKM